MILFRVIPKSLAIGVLFNLHSFSSQHDFLPSSTHTYSEKTHKTPIRQMKLFKADSWETEMLGSCNLSIEKSPIVQGLTTWLLSLGVGSCVSHALIRNYSIRIYMKNSKGQASDANLRR